MGKNKKTYWSSQELRKIREIEQKNLEEGHRWAAKEYVRWSEETEEGRALEEKRSKLLAKSKLLALILQ